MGAAYSKILPLTRQFFAIKRNREANFTIIDRTGQEIVGPLYKDICFLDSLRTDNEPYFQVGDGTYWGVHHGKKGLVLPIEYHKVGLLQGSTNGFVVQKDPRAGMKIIKNGRSICEPKYAQIDGFSPNFIRAGIVENRQVLFGVLDSLGAPLLDFLWPQINQLNDSWAIFIEEREVGVKMFYDEYLYSFALEDFHVLRDTTLIKEVFFQPKKTGTKSSKSKTTKRDNIPSSAPDKKELEKIRFSKVKKLTQDLIVKDTVVINKDSAVIRTYKLVPQKNKYRSLNELAIQFINGNKKGILNNLGNVVLPSKYDSIVPYTDSLFLVQDWPTWGLFHLDKGFLTKIDYSSFVPINDHLIKIRSRGRMGVMNQFYEEVIPPQFSRIVVDSNKIKAYAGDKMSMYWLNLETGKVVNFKEFDGVIQIRVNNAPTVNREAKPQKRPKAFAGFSFSDDFKAPDSIVGSRWNYEWKPFQKHFALNSKTANQLVGSADKFPPYPKVVFIGPPKLNLFYDKQNAISLSGHRLNVVPKKNLVPMALFGHNEGRMLTDFKMLGLRRHDFERKLPSAAFIDLDGYFGLIDTSGQERLNEDGEPLRFSYIGEFIEGKARVCLGGKLTKAGRNDNYRYYVNPISKFWKNFCLYTSSGATWLYKPEMNKQMVVSKFDDSQPKWGVIDSLGNLVLEPENDMVLPIDDQQSVIIKNGKWGLWDFSADSLIIDFKYDIIYKYFGFWKVHYPSNGTILFDEKGRELASFKYADYKPFNEERAAVRHNEDGTWGFINSIGEEVIPCQYDFVGRFSEGLVSVKKGDQWKVLDSLGKEVINFTSLNISVDSVGMFTDGMCVYKSNGFAGYIDKKGKVVIPADQYINALNFYQGAARVVDPNRKIGLINKKGNFILEPSTYDVIWDFDEEGIAKVIRKYATKNYELINIKGALVTKGQLYKEIGPFREGLARVKQKGQYGFLDTEGNLVIDFQYFDATDFSDGIAAVKKQKEHWTYIDTKGEKIIDQKFPVAKPFQNGLALVQTITGKRSSRKIIDKLGNPLPIAKGQFQFHEEGIFGMYEQNPIVKGHNYYYADRFGNNLFDLSFQDIEPFKNGYATAKFGNRKVILDHLGMLVLKPKYLSVKPLGATGHSIVYPTILGIFNLDGTPRLKPDFDLLEFMDGDIFKVEKGEKIGYMDQLGNWIWPMTK